ncbi:glycosyltransferase [Polynucleobacter sp. AP-Sanab-80-C2]|jgi:biofilm PGA synthesis N-glycosyltransferase PgaC|uniref:glycosyltransferase n=1 Tax=Polynucleobacter sp. AP-Sanab-80-C2 TaxID=3108274 RepID=UPI002B231A39|nr:glycosyltransferase [Polynucleobacter sp. AP-Sanab-80-C2]MEA9599143.1 glycosyltransferase [Polynucleobacter sp. AP-Sanab-80-C2]
MLLYFSVKSKFFLALIFALSWMGFSFWYSQPWYSDLSNEIGSISAYFLITFIAIIPGFMNAFVSIALFLDKRPKVIDQQKYPPVTVLIAAYNEEKSIASTLSGIFLQDYPESIRIIVINDGSSDKTVDSVRNLQASHQNLELIDLGHNGGKASALNHGLRECKTDIIISIDADSYILQDGVRNLVGRYLSDPVNTKAVAGEILIRNSRENWITKAQEWDYFLGIATIKRIQSLFQGTLVAQGAFSLYDRETVMDLGGWPEMVGEDIVLTWKILAAGYRVGHAENALAFTDCPDTLSKFIHQRRRWSRGLIEAFKENPSILFKPRYSTLYVWWNTLFPLMDIAFTFGFIPGIILACFGVYWIVGPMTLSLLPMAFLLNWQMYLKGKTMFNEQNLKVRANILGFMFYVLAYGLILQPACVYGYFSEIFKLRKSWGTK